MAKRYIVQITGGTSAGPYNIYYNSVNSSNFAIDVSTNLIASGLSYSYLSTLPGVTVEVPDNTFKIIVYNTDCGTSVSIDVLSSIVNLTVVYQGCDNNGDHSGRFVFVLDNVLGNDLKIEESTLTDQDNVPLFVQENSTNNSAKPYLPLIISGGTLSGYTSSIEFGDAPYLTSQIKGSDIVYSGTIYTGGTQWIMPNGQTVRWFTNNNPQVNVNFEPDFGYTNNFCIIGPTPTPTPSSACQCFEQVDLEIYSSGTIVYDNCFGGTFTIYVNVNTQPTYTILDGDFVNINSLRGTASYNVTSTVGCDPMTPIPPPPTQTPIPTTTSTPTPTPSPSPLPLTAPPTPTPSGSGPTPTPMGTGPTPTPFPTPNTTRQPLPNFIINNYSSTGRIDDLIGQGGIAFYLLNGTFPVFSNSSLNGTQNGYSNTISISLIGPTFGGCLFMTINGVEVHSETIYSGVQTVQFTSAEYGSFISSDKVVFTLQDGVC